MANCSTLPGVEVLRRAHTVSVKALITVSQLRGAGQDVRWPIAGCQKLCSTRNYAKVKGAMKDKNCDLLKRHMKETGISRDTWE